MCTNVQFKIWVRFTKFGAWQGSVIFSVSGLLIFGRNRVEIMISLERYEYW
jgi:hypothetical protein